jgi:hypothetical protein
MRVEVRDKDITGLNIAVSPGVTLRGEVAITGGGALRPDAVRIQLQSLGTLPPQVATTAGLIPVDANGKFEINNLSEGRYRISANIREVPQASYVASIQQGGVNIYDDGFDVDTRSAQVPIRVEVNTAGEIVEGNVRINQLKDAASVNVVLVPSAARRSNPAFYRTTMTDDKGHFVIRGVAPGTYTIFAWDFALPGAWLNPDFVQKY